MTKLYEQLGRFEAEYAEPVELPRLDISKYLGADEPGFQDVPAGALKELRNLLVNDFDPGEGSIRLSMMVRDTAARNDVDFREHEIEIKRGDVSAETWALACTLDDALTIPGLIFVPGLNSAMFAGITGEGDGLDADDPAIPFVWPDGTVDDHLEWVFNEVEEEEDLKRLAFRLPFRSSCTNGFHYVFDNEPTAEEFISVVAEVVEAQMNHVQAAFARLRRLYNSGIVPRERFAENEEYLESKLEHWGLNDEIIAVPGHDVDLFKAAFEHQTGDCDDDPINWVVNPPTHVWVRFLDVESDGTGFCGYYGPKNSSDDGYAMYEPADANDPRAVPYTLARTEVVTSSSPSGRDVNCFVVTLCSDPNEDDDDLYRVSLFTDADENEVESALEGSLDPLLDNLRTGPDPDDLRLYREEHGDTAANEYFALVTQLTAKASDRYATAEHEMAARTQELLAIRGVKATVIAGVADCSVEIRPNLSTRGKFEH